MMPNGHKRSFGWKPYLALALISVVTIAYACRPRTSWPPTLVVNGSEYHGTGRELADLPGEAVCIGTVASRVPGHKRPTEEFQANYISPGSAVYQAEDRLVVYSGDRWVIYQLIEQKEGRP